MKKIGILLTLMLGCVVAALIVGCETESTPAAADVEVSPSSTSITVGGATNATVTNAAVLFTASGGDGIYIWSLSNPGIGTLVPSGATAWYTAEMIVGNNTIVVTSAGQTGTASISQN